MNKKELLGTYNEVVREERTSLRVIIRLTMILRLLGNGQI